MSINKNSVDISNLPFEVIAHILDFVSYPDLKDARLVCKTLYRASLSTKLAKSEVMHLKRLNVDLTSLLKCERKVYHLRIKRKIKIWSNEEFWSKFGSGLHSLTALSCNIREEHFYHALSFCSKLKVLDLRNTFRLRRFVPLVEPDFQLTELRSLVLSSMDFDDALCDAIVKRAPNLRVLTLDTVLEVTNVHYRGDPPFVYLVKYIKDNHNLRFDLKLTHKNNYDDAERALLKSVVQLPNVRVLLFDFFDEITDEWDLLALNGHSEIKEIRVAGMNVDDSVIKDVCEKFPNLEAFSARCDWNWNSLHSSLSNLNLLQNLISLDVFLPDEVTDADMLSGLCSSENMKLKNLKLKNYCLSENCLVEIMKCNPALKDLYLRSAYKCNTISDWSVQAIFKYQKQLEKLALVSSTLTDAGLSGKILEDDPAKSRQLNPTGHSISKLTRLRELALMHCEEIVGSAIVSDFKFPEIQAVKLWNLRKLSNEAALKSLIENNRTIEFLVLKQSRNVDFHCEDLARLITANLWRLKKLYVKGIHGMPRYWNHYIQEHFGNGLRIFRLAENNPSNWLEKVPTFHLMYNSDEDKNDGSRASSAPLSPPYFTRDPSPVSHDSDHSSTDTDGPSDEDYDL